jgi:predicted  nucleic acid-binding Zn-ribbon protein
LVNLAKGAVLVGKLDLATERFQRALSTLEREAAPFKTIRKTAEDAEAQIAQLNEERGKLLTRIAELEDEIQSLSGLTEEVEDRLDGAIAEIRTALNR